MGQRQTHQQAVPSQNHGQHAQPGQQQPPRHVPLSGQQRVQTQQAPIVGRQDGQAQAARQHATGVGTAVAHGRQAMPPEVPRQRSGTAPPGADPTALAPRQRARPPPLEPVPTACPHRRPVEQPQVGAAARSPGPPARRVRRPSWGPPDPPPAPRAPSALAGTARRPSGTAWSPAVAAARCAGNEHHLPAGGARNLLSSPIAGHLDQLAALRVRTDELNGHPTPPFPKDSSDVNCPSHYTRVRLRRKQNRPIRPTRPAEVVETAGRYGTLSARPDRPSYSRG